MTDERIEPGSESLKIHLRHDLFDDAFLLVNLFYFYYFKVCPTVFVIDKKQPALCFLCDIPEADEFVLIPPFVNVSVVLIKIRMTFGGRNRHASQEFD